jgi:hypothetical protein
MAQNVYIGLAVSSDDWASSNPPTLATATFDNVSVSSTAVAAPVMSAVSATTGTIGSQVVISGTGFGASQGNSVVTLNGGLATINSWSSTSVTITIPSGATSGPLAVAVAPSMNSSNAVMFTVTTQPLPASWLDQDVGQVGKAGSASYANGTFTVSGSGQWIWSTADGMHFVYQPLLGDGTMVARVVSAQGGSSYAQAGVMIRETLSPGSTQGYTLYQRSLVDFSYRTSTGASTTEGSSGTLTLPYWVKVVRSGSTFSGYNSLDGVNWTQVGTAQTINMAQNVYIGLAVSSDDWASSNPPTLATATFDNVSISPTAP